MAKKAKPNWFNILIILALTALFLKLFFLFGDISNGRKAP